MTADSFFSHQFATPSAMDRGQGLALLDTFRRDPPGQWSGNKFQQSSKFTGPVYLAVNTFMTAAGGATITCQRKRRSKNKTTFIGDKAIHKAVSAAAPTGGDWEFVPAESDHPVQRLLDHPNERGDTFRDVYEYLMLQDGLTGVAPLWCIPNHQHKPVELYGLPTALVTPQFARTDQYPNGSYRLMPYYASGSTGYLPGKYAVTGAIIPAEELPRRKRPHPFLMWDGYSPLSAGGVELDILEAIDQCWWGVLDHGVIMDTVLMMPGQDQTSITRFEQELKQKHGGSRNMRRMFMLGGGDGNAKYDVKQLSPNVRDMDFPQGRATMLEFCLALFGVPGPVAGLVAATSYAQLYAALQQFRILKLAPDAQKWASWFTRHLCDPWCKRPGDYVIQIELPTLTDPDLQLKKDQANVGILTVNQRLAKENMPPVKYGDFPEAIYLDMIRKDVLPEPEPMLPGMPESKPGKAGTMPGVPKPDNAAGKGSKGPMMKAATTMDDPAGGFLVPQPKKRVLKGKKAKKALACMVKAIVEDAA